MHILYLIHGSARSNDALDFDILGAFDLRCKKKTRSDKSITRFYSGRLLDDMDVFYALETTISPMTNFCITQPLLPRET
jgi:hypothetical protein